MTDLHPMNRGHYLHARTGNNKPPSLASDPIPKFIYKKMERRWATKFSEGSVKIGSLFYYRMMKDESRTIVDPHEGLEVSEVTAELAVSPALALISGGNVPPVGTRLYNVDDRRLVFCASEATSIPSSALPATYDCWIQIEAAPAIVLIHQELLKRVPDADGPVFKQVIYDPALDGPDDSPPDRPLFELVAQGMQLNDRWFKKRTEFREQREVRVGWLADPKVCREFTEPLAVDGLQDLVKLLD